MKHLFLILILFATACSKQDVAPKAPITIEGNWSFDFTDKTVGGSFTIETVNNKLAVTKGSYYTTCCGGIKNTVIIGKVTQLPDDKTVITLQGADISNALILHVSSISTDGNTIISDNTTDYHTLQF